MNIRERVADPDEAARLLAVLDEETRAIIAVAVYAGLRRGEVVSLEWEDVNLAAGTLNVRWSWDAKTGQFVAPKSDAGTRTVPIVGPLRDVLAERKARTRREAGLVFPRESDPPRPVVDSTLWRRARKAWEDWNKAHPDAPMLPLGLHEARHSAASVFIAAGVNAKAVSTFLGHSSIEITYDLYGHLLDGAEDEARVLVDAYLERASSTARLAQVGVSS